MPAILIGIAITVFFMFANPIYSEIGGLRAQVASYDEALSNSKALKNEIDKLTAKYNAIDRDDLIKLQKLLPDNIDNIRLILEIEQIALPYGMALKDVKYNATNDPAKGAGAGGGAGTEGAPAVLQGGGTAIAGGKDYGAWDLSFSTTGTYDNFLRFTRALESNLRIVDISSIQFSSGTENNGSSSASSGSPSSAREAYKYDFKIKTYWLKN